MGMASTTVETEYAPSDRTLLDRPSDADVSSPQVDNTLQSEAQSTSVTPGVEPIPPLEQGALVVDWDGPEDPRNPRK